MTDWKKHPKKTAKKAIGLLDLTNLNDVCTRKDIEDLCARAKTHHGKTAAICIWKEHIPQARQLLKGSGIAIATVVNFPDGSTDVDRTVSETIQAIADGADEIDMVLPYRALIAGADGVAAHMVRAVRKACGKKILKVIIETGELGSDKLIGKASKIALENGADFIKTSTGKVPVNATPQAATIMLKAARDFSRKQKSKRKPGFKPAGGIKTTDDAATYLALCEAIMGKSYLSPKTLRFGASSVLANLLATLDEKAGVAPGEGY